jgi:hypothetical protein
LENQIVLSKVGSLKQLFSHDNGSVGFDTFLRADTSFIGLGSKGAMASVLYGGIMTLAHPGGGGRNDSDPETSMVLYFCPPHNEKLLGYWDTMADRLFKDSQLHEHRRGKANTGTL